MCLKIFGKLLFNKPYDSIILFHFKMHHFSKKGKQIRYNTAHSKPVKDRQIICFRNVSSQFTFTLFMNQFFSISEGDSQIWFAENEKAPINK